MKKQFTLFLCLAIPLLCMAQNPLPVKYEYDKAGNRTARKTITVQNSPPVQGDSINELSVFSEQLSAEEEFASQTSLMPSNFEAPEYFVERIAQVEMKIYPNPATEKITLQVANMDNLQTGVFKLLTLNGQLLQEQAVHSSATEISLLGLAKGVYILKVNVNGRVEDWKVIKQ
jgi:hypothetical protein